MRFSTQASALQSTFAAWPREDAIWIRGNPLLEIERSNNQHHAPKRLGDGSSPFAAQGGIRSVCCLESEGIALRRTASCCSRDREPGVIIGNCVPNIDVSRVTSTIMHHRLACCGHWKRILIMTYDGRVFRTEVILPIYPKSISISPIIKAPLLKKRTCDNYYMLGFLLVSRACDWLRLGGNHTKQRTPANGN